VDLPGLFLIYKLPNENHPDSYALQLMNSILAGSESSRIYKQLVEKKQLSTAAFSFPYMLENAGMDIIASICAKGKTTDENLAAIEEEISNIQTNLVSDEELEKVKNQMEKQFIERMGNIANVAEILAQSYMYQGSTELANTELANYMKVTKEDIQRVAKQYLTKDNRIVLKYVPKQK
jgi:predicted Zn-dependent peptidase